MEYRSISELFKKEESLSQPRIMESLLEILIEESYVNPEIGLQEQSYILWLMLVIVDMFDLLN
ncbi:hypothetical protein JXJ21_23195 [candidate division KSB1 bacterium]|nr:hypothetical protein [candidate division KSB1 bacterium]